jgi:hypothetical protein
VALAVVAVASACAPEIARPALPKGPDGWLVFDVDVPERDPHVLVRSFTARARSHGCELERGTDTRSGWARGYSTILAQCDDGTIVMEAVDYARVRLACPKPATREQCEALLGRIIETP